MKNKSLIALLLVVVAFTCLLGACSHTHEFGDWVVTKQATCTEDGQQTRTCKCGEKETQPISALGHDEETHQAQVATCQGVGWQSYVTCKREGCDYSTYSEIAATGHTAGQWITDVEPTCTTEGSKHQVCATCGETLKTEKIPVVAHSFGAWMVVEASTCAKQGYEERSCSCGETETRDIALAEHIGGQWITDNDPTCTTEGSKHQVCAVCGETIKTEVIDALGHSYQTAVIDPTCTKQGYSTHTCSVCGDSYVDTYIAATGHTDGEWITDFEPTCITKGSKHQVCATCGETIKTEVIDALGHDEIVHEAKAPTCTETGWDAYVTCGRCDYTTYAEIPALGHTDGEWTVDIEETCATAGSKHQVCAVCGKTIATETISATGNHLWDDGEETQSPTCTEPGEITYKCTVCKTASRTEEIPALGHTDGEWITDIEPTCTNEGSKHQVCATCGETIKTEVVEKIPHKYADTWTNNATSHWHECTCGDKADEAEHTPSAPATTTTPQTCTVCDYVIQEATGIVFKTLNVDGTNVYGKVSNTTTMFSFINEVKANGNTKFVVSLDVYGIQQVATKTIPLEIGDNTVYITELINDEPTAVYTATVRRRPMYEVTFNANGGTSVETQIVEEDSFAIIPETNKDGYSYVWDYDFSLPITQDTEITAIWTAHTDTKYTVNYYLQNLENDEYTLHETVELTGTTDTTAYGEATRYTHFTYNEGKSTVSGNIHGDSSLVLNVYYNRNVYTLSVTDVNGGKITNAGSYRYGYAFETMVSDLHLGYDFLGWYSDDELLSTDTTFTFTADTNILAKFIPKEEIASFKFASTATTCTITGLKDKTATEIIVPDYVTSISNYAFRGCSSLTSITLPFVGATLNGTSDTHFGYIFGASACYDNDDYVPSSLKSVVITGGSSIGEDAFYNCSSLTSITIPDSVTSIGSSAFYNCSSLTSVHITDIATWCNISFGSYGANPVCYARSLYLNNQLVSELIIPDSVTSISDYAFYNCSSLTNITIPDSVTSIGNSAFSGCDSLTSITIPDSVTSIGGSAFYNCSSLTSITIPESVTSIGNYAFYNCSNLTSVTIGNSVTSIGSSAFDGCSSLPSITIPNGVTSIGSYAFDGCSSLASITIPDSVTSIGSGAFYNCSSLTSITIPDSVTSIGNHAFYNCNSLTSITIPDGVTSIGSSAFYNCSSLSSITIPDGVTSIGNFAFYICRSLTSITIPDSVTSIGQESFAGCWSLTSITIPDSVTSIGEEAFAVCRSLTSITIPDSVISIGEGAFSSCSSLESITIPFVGGELYNTSSNTYFGYIFGASYSSENSKYIPTSLKTVIITGGSSIGSSAFYNCHSLTSIIIPDGVTSIGSSAFYGCSSLTSITIPNWVRSIGGAAFRDCSSLTSITIPDSVTSIGGRAFNGCSSLASVTIGNSVTSISDYAFWACSSLTSITIPDSVTSIGQESFVGCWSLTSITIPDSVTSIGISAFHSCSRLTSVTIGNSVKSIGNYAFRYCRGLTSITIPDSVTYIGYSAFEDCSSLTSVYYTGTQEQWEVISIDSYNTELTNANRYYYSECIHGSNQWRYDNDGNISTELTIGEGIVDVEPTCTTTGSKHAICSVCGETVTLEIPALGHDYGADGTCTVCGEERPYTITNDATYAFVETDGVLQSTNKENSSSSSYVITATATITITFEYNVSSESGYDKFYILHNSTQKVVLSGTSNSYTSYSITLNAGDTLTFKYTKDSSTSKGDDCCYIKNLTITTVN